MREPTGLPNGSAAQVGDGSSDAAWPAHAVTDALVLTQVEPDFRPLLLVGDRQSAGSAVYRWVGSRLAARVVRGSKMLTRTGLFDEFAAALQFPHYFGKNWDAFDECLADLDILTAGAGYVVVMTEPEHSLRNGPGCSPSSERFDFEGSPSQPTIYCLTCNDTGHNR